MKPIKEMAADELTEWAKLHIMKWHPSKPFHNFHPATDWNDAIRVAREAQRHRQMFRDDLIGIDVIRNEPEDLLRQTCIEYAAAEFTHVCWIPDDQA